MMPIVAIVVISSIIFISIFFYIRNAVRKHIEEMQREMVVSNIPIAKSKENAKCDDNFADAAHKLSSYIFLWIGKAHMGIWTDVDEIRNTVSNLLEKLKGGAL